jgi:hypothetical protein
MARTHTVTGVPSHLDNHRIAWINAEWEGGARIIIQRIFKR